MSTNKISKPFRSFKHFLSVGRRNYEDVYKFTNRSINDVASEGYLVPELANIDHDDNYKMVLLPALCIILYQDTF